MSPAVPSLDALVGRIPPLARGLACALLLGAVLVAMVWERAAILRDGSEVRLATAPIDPRDLFRGDYVILFYRVSLVEETLLPAGLQVRNGQMVYVELAPGADGLAGPVAVHLAHPGGDRIALAGRVKRRGACPWGEEPNVRRCAPGGPRALELSYGLESYFVPEGEGRWIERLDTGRVEVVAAVGRSGKAAIKRLLVDGRAIYDEPPY